MNRHEQQRNLDRDLARLRHLLRDALRDSGVTASKEEELRILDLACGRCDEAELLVNLLPDLLAGKSKPVETTLVGVDIRAREIADAVARCRTWNREHREKFALPPSTSPAPASVPPPPPHFEFLAGDATKVGSHRELGDNFDVVVFRHQNYWDGDGTWKEIFAQGLEKLSPDGVMICTSYFDREHALALKAIRELGGEVLLSRENPEGRKLLTPGKTVDKHIAVIRRKAT